MKRRGNYFPYILLAPSLLVLGAVVVFPVIQACFWSFLSMNFKSPKTIYNFVGFSHYTNVFRSAEFWNSLLITAEYTVFGAGGAFLIGLITAVLLNEDFRGRFIARALVISPWPIPYVVGCLVWMWMLDYQFGIANHLLLRIELTASKVGWLYDPKIAMFSVIAATIWKEFPFATIMLLAGLQNIPPEQYEQASVDGANFFQIFWHVTLPNMRSVTTIVWLLLIIWIFKRFTIIFIMTGGGPAGATETLIVKTYLTAFNFARFGEASAIGMVMLIITLAFASIYLWLQEKRRV